MNKLYPVYVLSFWDSIPSELSFFKDGALGTCISEDKLREFGVDIQHLDYLIADKCSVIIHCNLRGSELTDQPYTGPSIKERKAFVKDLEGLHNYFNELGKRKQSLCPRQS